MNKNHNNFIRKLRIPLKYVNLMNHFGLLVCFNHLKRLTEVKNYRFLNQPCKIRTQEQKIKFIYDINLRNNIKYFDMLQ